MTDAEKKFFVAAGPSTAPSDGPSNWRLNLALLFLGICAISLPLHCWQHYCETRARVRDVAVSQLLAAIASIDRSVSDWDISPEGMRLSDEEGAKARKVKTERDTERAALSKKCEGLLRQRGEEIARYFPELVGESKSK